MKPFENALEDLRKPLGEWEEGLALFLSGVTLPFIMAGNILFGEPIPRAVVSITMMLWVLWFVIFATKGGVPRMTA